MNTEKNYYLYDCRVANETIGSLFYIFLCSLFRNKEKIIRKFTYSDMILFTVCMNQLQTDHTIGCIVSVQCLLCNNPYITSFSHIQCGCITEYRIWILFAVDLLIVSMVIDVLFGFDSAIKRTIFFCVIVCRVPCTACVCNWTIVAEKKEMKKNQNEKFNQNGFFVFDARTNQSDRR